MAEDINSDKCCGSCRHWGKFASISGRENGWGECTNTDLPIFICCEGGGFGEATGLETSPSFGCNGFEAK